MAKNNNRNKAARNDTEFSSEVAANNVSAQQQQQQARNNNANQNQNQNQQQ